MSSMFPPYGSASTKLCQRCGVPLPPNQVYCANCGQYNTPDQVNNLNNPSNISWGGTPSQTSPASGTGQPNQPWGQPTVQPGQNNPFSGYAPAQQFGNQSPRGENSPGPNGLYGAPNQGLQQSNPANLFGTSAPSQPYYPQAMPGTFQPGAFSPSGSMNGFQQTNFDQAPEPKRGSRVGLIIGIVSLLVVLLGGGVFGYYYKTKYFGSGNVQITPTVAPTPTPKGPALFSDLFTNNNNGWDLTSKRGEFLVKVGSGSMLLEDDNHKLLWELVPGGKSFDNFYLTVDASLSKGTQDNGYGVYVRGSSNQNSDIATYYRYELYGDGTFAVFKGTVDANGISKSSTLVDFSTNSAILKEGHVNHIAISAIGPKLTFIVNGQILKTVSDNSYPSGSVALFVSNLPNTTTGAQATFTNFKIFPPQS